MRSPYLDALLYPPHLALLGLAVAAGLCSAWWLFPIGLVLWVVVVLMYANDPALRLNYQMQARTAALSQHFAAHYEKITRSQARIFNTIASLRRSMRQAFGPVHDEVEALTDRIYDLCQRMTALDNYHKVTRSHIDLEGEQALAKLALEGVTDPATRAEKTEALKAVEKRTAEFKQITTLLERVDTQIISLNSEMASWLAEIVRLQARSVADVPARVESLLAKIRAQKDKLAEFDEAVTRLP